MENRRFVVTLMLISSVAVSVITDARIVSPPRQLARRRCMDNCRGRPNGDYQACDHCDGYVTCSNSALIIRPCPGSTVWDDASKACMLDSSTCPEGCNGDPGSGCVTSCASLTNGDYQSCRSCGEYVTCSNGAMFDGGLCPSVTVWDDLLKRCEWTSSTCTQCE